jgi:hypothetical protein
MTELTQKRINFIETLHEVFVTKKGFGAFAYISITEVMVLFDGFLNSNESADEFINRFVNSIKFCCTINCGLITPWMVCSTVPRKEPVESSLEQRPRTMQQQLPRSYCRESLSEE